MPSRTSHAESRPAADEERSAPRDGQPAERAQRAKPGRPASSEGQHERKQRVLTQGTSSVVHGIADALVIKSGDIFFLCKPDGDVPVDGDHGYGLYHADCRFLRGYELRIEGDVGDRLASSAGQGDTAVIELTNPDIRAGDGRTLPKERVGLTWTRALDGGRLRLQDTIALENFSLERSRFTLGLHLDARFEDIFDIRGLLDEEPGRLHPPAWRDGRLVFAYDGADDRERRLEVTFDPAPTHRDGEQASFEVDLDPRETQQIAIGLQVVMRPLRNGEQRGDGRTASSGRDAEATKAVDHPRPTHTGARHGGGSRTEVRPTEVRSNSLLLEGILRRSLEDLRVLRSEESGQEYFAAGLPWFGTLFGRDSLLTAVEMLPYDPWIAEQTLRVLASRQGSQVDDYREEQPGKILHELRVGELAALGAIPHTPFYGTVDATPLFCLLFARHATWTGSLDLFHELREHVDRALDWIDGYGDSDADGFTDYASSTGRGLVNQGWKDSGDAIANADGSLATPPIALVEVQGYVYAAKHELAALYGRAGDGAKAERLRKEAQQLRQRFEDRFWMEGRGTYALALQRDGKPAEVVSSNPGQALWGGIASPARAAGVRDSLMADSMFSGWGVRTLSVDERRYNPIGYHLGTVWPHDNALVAAGLRRYGFDDEADRIASGIIEAAARFPEYRLPEVFAGYDRSRFAVPVHYPVACHPQAWAAGAVPYLLMTMLGVEARAFDHQLRIARPALPGFVDSLELHGLRVGQAEADLRFERTASGVAVEAMEVRGDLRIFVEPAPLREEPARDAGRASGRGGSKGGQARGRRRHEAREDQDRGAHDGRPGSHEDARRPVHAVHGEATKGSHGASR
ncbi:MAG TPA: glycogen debranching N-terminal domain-containing protein [Candidatus Limnocylindrales bacterium]